MEVRRSASLNLMKLEQVRNPSVGIKRGIVISLLLSFCMLFPEVVRAQNTAKLSLGSIEKSYVGVVSENTNKPVDFVVLIENTSSHDIGVHRQWNSWGYYSIHFVVARPDGRQVIIEKKERAWSYNFPDCFRLPPGMTHAFPICLTSNEWNGVEAIAAKGAKLKAVFQQEPLETRENKWGADFHIFTRKIESGFVAWDVLTARKAN